MRQFVLGAAICCLSLPAVAQTLYVTDVLRLGLHSEPNSSEKPIKILVSGDAVEIIVLAAQFAQVRTADGDVGWVKSNYLVEEKPAKTVVVDLGRERDRLTAELATIRGQLEDQGLATQTLRDERDDLQRSAGDVATQLTALREQNNLLSEELTADRFSVPIYWLLAAALAALLGGFVCGWWWTDAKQRSRHGGFRI